MANTCTMIETFSRLAALACPGELGVKVGVLSDTHVDSIDSLSRRLVNELSGMDLIIHAGDFTGRGLVDQLRALGPFRGVYGNIDGPDVRSVLHAVDTVDVEGLKIGVNHPSEGGSPRNLEERIGAKFPNANAIIHGHSHQTKNVVKNGVLWFNPGSATGTFPARKATYGVLYVDKQVRGEIFEL